MDRIKKNFGFGCMRLPMIGEEVDIEQTKQMVDAFIEGGGTYFDTAFVYHEGASEKALKEALVKRYPRDAYTVATKCLAWAAPSAEEAKSNLATSLERMGLDYVDFYLLHNVGGERTAKFDAYGMWDFALDAKERGLIRVLAVRDVSLDVFPAEIVGIVGESGSGKSSLMKCLFFDEEATEGDVRARPFDGGAANLLQLSPQHQRAIRNTVFGMVYQNPYLGLRMDFSSLSNIAEQMIAAGNRNVGAMRVRGEELLARVNIPLSREAEPPRNFSGGMQQRVQIAKALSNNPPILLLDEVTTGLDLSVQAAVLDLIQQIRRDFNVSMLVVSHDLGVIRMLADRTLVMLDGRVIESGLTDQILEDPQHSYTQQLVYSLL